MTPSLDRASPSTFEVEDSTAVEIAFLSSKEARPATVATGNGDSFVVSGSPSRRSSATAGSSRSSSLSPILSTNSSAVTKIFDDGDSERTPSVHSASSAEVTGFGSTGRRTSGRARSLVNYAALPAGWATMLQNEEEELVCGSSPTPNRRKRNKSSEREDSEQLQRRSPRKMQAAVDAMTTLPPRPVLPPLFQRPPIQLDISSDSLLTELIPSKGPARRGRPPKNLPALALASTISSSAASSRAPPSRIPQAVKKNSPAPSFVAIPKPIRASTRTHSVPVGPVNSLSASPSSGKHVAIPRPRRHRVLHDKDDDENKNHSSSSSPSLETSFARIQVPSSVFLGTSSSPSPAPSTTTSNDRSSSPSPSTYPVSQSSSLNDGPSFTASLLPRLRQRPAASQSLPTASPSSTTKARATPNHPAAAATPSLLTTPTVAASASSTSGGAALKTPKKKKRPLPMSGSGSRRRRSSGKRKNKAAVMEVYRGRASLGTGLGVIFEEEEEEEEEDEDEDNSSRSGGYGGWWSRSMSVSGVS